MTDVTNMDESGISSGLTLTLGEGEDASAKPALGGFFLSDSTVVTTGTTTACDGNAETAPNVTKSVIVYVQNIKAKEPDDNDIFEPLLKDRNRIAVGKWVPEEGLVELIQMRGNFWKIHGFAMRKKDYLFPEEALLLLEKSLLMIEYNGVRLSLKEFYEIALTLVPLECYMAYSKLKSLEYIVFRHSDIDQDDDDDNNNNNSDFNSNNSSRSRQAPLCVITDENDLKCIYKEGESSFFDKTISYDIYLHTSGWSKKCLIDSKPVHHVIVHNGEFMPNSKWLFRLLDGAKTVPLLFAIITSTMSIILEEVADAELQLKFHNEVAIPLSGFSNGPERELKAFNIDEFMFRYHETMKEKENESSKSGNKKRKFEKDKKNKRDPRQKHRQ